VNIFLTLILILFTACEGRDMKTAKLRAHVLSRGFNEMAIGRDTERRDGFDPRLAQREGAGFSGCHIEDVSVTVGAVKLSGYVYRPALAVFPPDGAGQKAVIFFSGSGGSNAAQIGEAAAAYNSLGAVVVGIDYRGFGGSGGADMDGGNITEASICTDARSIYDYVNRDLGFPPEAIVLHGFSLGGTPAAYLAADLAERGVRLGGLALHSSIAAMTEAAAGTLPLPGPLAGFAGWAGALLTGGAYDTRAHLKRLSVLDPEIPLHLRSGSAATGDELGTDVTGLDGAGDFRNRSVYAGGEGHQINGKTAANMRDGFDGLAAILTIKRGAL
jgi:pimeloyl-ACP methyl ester carboxylesterase